MTLHRLQVRFALEFQGSLYAICNSGGQPSNPVARCVPQRTLRSSPRAETSFRKFSYGLATDAVICLAALFVFSAVCSGNQKTDLAKKSNATGATSMKILLG
jgi:hypothetical protein